MTAAELYERSKYFFPPPPVPHEARDDLIPASAGVYFIYEDRSIVYVGESADLRARLRRHPHITSSRNVAVIECEASQRKRLEAFYIGVFNPLLNRESTFRCAVANRRRRKDASLHRRLYLFVAENPGCSLSELRQATGWSRASRIVRKAIDRLKEWKLIREVLTPTDGRTKRIYFCQ